MNVRRGWSKGPWFAPPSMTLHRAGANTDSCLRNDALARRPPVVGLEQSSSSAASCDASSAMESGFDGVPGIGGAAPGKQPARLKARTALSKIGSVISLVVDVGGCRAAKASPRASFRRRAKVTGIQVLHFQGQGSVRRP